MLQKVEIACEYVVCGQQTDGNETNIIRAENRSEGATAYLQIGRYAYTKNYLRGEIAA